MIKVTITKWQPDYFEIFFYLTDYCGTRDNDWGVIYSADNRLDAQHGVWFKHEEDAFKLKFGL
jgi:hypothetical protein